MSLEAGSEVPTPYIGNETCLLHSKYTLSGPHQMGSNDCALVREYALRLMRPTSGKRREGIVGNIMARVANRKLERLNLDVDPFDTEQALLRRLDVVDKKW